MVEASASCQQMGGFLAEPRSEEMSTALKKIISESAKFWIGIKDSAKNGIFLWQTNNAALSYKDWDVNQPNNNDGQQLCVKMNENHKWDDRECTTPLEYICQAQKRE